MASGQTHDRITVLMTPAVIIGGICWTGDLALGLTMGFSNLVGGLWLSPDLDLKSRPWRRWGIVRFIWLPYQRLPHRHWLTHTVVIGTVGRFAYLLAPVLLVLLSLGLSPVVLWAWLVAYQSVCLAVFLGVELSAIAHLIADGILLRLPRL